MRDILRARRRERDELIATARRYVDDLAQRVEVVAAAVAGSVARGDFNLWSDIDVVVVADSLPSRIPERTEVLMRGVFPRVQPVGFTVQEFQERLARRDRLVCEAVAEGVPLLGDLRAVAGSAPGDAR